MVQQQFIVKQQQQRLLIFWTLVLNLIQIYYPGYRLMDVNILDGIFNCLTCPECYEVETLHLNDTNTKKKGPARLMYLKCNSCTYVKEFYTSKNVMILSKKGEESLWRSTFVQWWYASFWGRIYTAKEIVLLLEYA